MQELAKTDALIISQKKEWTEIFTSIETRNKYSVLSPEGEELYYALEEGGSFLARIFLKAMRPFQINIVSTENEDVLTVTRPFRFYFHELTICDAQGQHLGSIKRQFSFLRRMYSVLDNNGQEIYQLFGPILKPWTFQIKQGETELGTIVKKWSGLLKEGFTDADNFGINFPPRADLQTKAILLGAVFLIDFVHFENSGSSSN